VASLVMVDTYAIDAIQDSRAKVCGAACTRCRAMRDGAASLTPASNQIFFRFLLPSPTQHTCTKIVPYTSRSQYEDNGHAPNIQT
jgi:hypothetical protein